MRNFKELLILDSRSLALYRVLLGLLTVCCFAQAVGLWDMLFSYRGVLPPAIAPRDVYHWSLFYWLPESLHISVLFVGIVFALLFTWGIWLRPTTLVILLIMISLHHRNPTAVGNALHPVLLFCSLFMPLDKASFKKPYFGLSSWGNFLLIGQISLLYFFAFLFKWEDLPFWSGRGFFYALSYSPYVRPLGELFLAFPAGFGFLATFTQLARLAGSIAIWFPLPKLRGSLVIAFFFIHIVFALALTLGLFTFLCLAIWCALIPSQWWDRRKTKQLTTIKPENFKFQKELALGAFTLLLIINLGTLTRNGNFIWKGAEFLGLFQRWSLFAEMGGEHRWVKVSYKTQTREERTSSLFPTLPSDSWKPVSSLYPSEISRRFHDRFVWELEPRRIHAYGTYVCRKLAEKGESPQTVKLDVLATRVEDAQRPPYKYSVIRNWEFPCL